MQSAKQVSIHLVVSQSSAHLTDALRALADQTWQDLQVVVVNNAAADWQPPWPAGQGPDVVTLRNFRDQGFVRAHNQAIAFALSRWPKEVLSERFILFLSPRVTLAKEALSELMSVGQAEPEIDLIGPTVFRAATRATEEGEERELEASETVESAGVFLRKSRTWGEVRRGERLVGSHEQTEVFGPPISCCLIRASALAAAQISGEWFDSDLSAPQAMVDLFWRCRLMGKRAVWAPRATAWYQVAASPTAKLSRMTRLLAWFRVEAMERRAMERETCCLQIKNDTVLQQLRYFPRIMVGQLQALAIMLIYPRGWLRWCRGLAALPRLFRKRRELRQRLGKHAAELSRWFI